MDKLFDICHECQHRNCEVKPLEALSLSTTDNPQFFCLNFNIKFQRILCILKIIEKNVTETKNIYI